MCYNGRGLGNVDPEHERSYVTSHHHRSDQQWHDVGEQVFHRVTVEGDHADGGCPLMVDLVNVTVHPGVMEYSARKQHQMELEFDGTPWAMA